MEIKKIYTESRKVQLDKQCIPDLSNSRAREGIQTKDTDNTKRYMLEPFTKGDINNEDNDDNRRARLQSQLTTNTAEGK